MAQKQRCKTRIDRHILLWQLFLFDSSLSLEAFFRNSSVGNTFTDNDVISVKLYLEYKQLKELTFFFPSQRGIRIQTVSCNISLVCLQAVSMCSLDTAVGRCCFARLLAASDLARQKTEPP